MGVFQRLAAVGLLALLAACSGGDDSSAEAASTSAPRFLALGDSISAGGGAPPYDQAVARCSRSRNNSWPAHVDAALADLELTELRACGGAKASHLIGAWEDLALDPQIPGAQDPSVELVTLTIGFNDIGYGSFLFICLEDCATSTPEGDAAYQARLAAFRASLVNDVYPSLRVAYPNARILHVGYPRVLTSDTPVGCSWLEPEEQALADRAMGELNGAIVEAVTQAADPGLEFVDVAEVLAGHELCSEEPWVVRLEDGADGGHPTAEGYEAIADAVLRAIEAEQP